MKEPVYVMKLNELAIDNDGELVRGQTMVVKNGDYYSVVSNVSRPNSKTASFLPLSDIPSWLIDVAISQIRFDGHAVYETGDGKIIKSDVNGEDQKDYIVAYVTFGEIDDKLEEGLRNSALILITEACEEIKENLEQLAKVSQRLLDPSKAQTSLYEK